MSLPEARDPGGPYRVCLVCLGNICRSPMAEQVLRAELGRAGLGGAVWLDSAGTGDWHIGSGMDRRAASTLRIHGFDTDHVARQFDRRWFSERDLILAMDADNRDDLLGGAAESERHRIRMFLPFAPGQGPHAEVPDPYYGGDDGFTAVLNMIESASKGLVGELAHHLKHG